jgi:hypothetical protein
MHCDETSLKEKLQTLNKQQTLTTQNITQALAFRTERK